MNELLAVGVGLFSHDVAEDQNHNIIGDVLGILNDGVSDEEEGSDILEAVTGEKEADSGELNSITKDGLNLLLNATFIVDWLSIFNESQNFGLNVLVVWVLC